ncbi:MAG: DUF4350 domain-containing protein [Defluviitaleaceae bacterium]|nr:DUF4350 domain-containing protein [Defluviitaleaceae bacterium]
MQKNRTLIIVLIVATALAVSLLFDTESGLPYSYTNTTESGTSVFYDTLRHMGYSVRAKKRHKLSNTGDVCILVQPDLPMQTSALLDWVRDGGRLIFLHQAYPRTPVDTALRSGTSAGGYTIYRHGAGEIITGDVNKITNGELINSHIYGEMLQTTLDRWHTERELNNIIWTDVILSEHGGAWSAGGSHSGRHGGGSGGTHTEGEAVGFYEGLPLIIKVIAAQLLIGAVLVVLFFAKRMGNPVPLYEEVERQENEYIHALARLYGRVRGKGRK